MKDMLASLEKLRADAAEAALIRDLATDSHKRELFTRLADHLAALAAEVERAIGKHAAEQKQAARESAVSSSPSLIEEWLDDQEQEYRNCHKQSSCKRHA